MSWTSPRTWVTAEVVTAAIMNQHVRDNLLQTAPAIVTTAGDLVVATGANALARLAIGATNSLASVVAGTVAWVTGIAASIITSGQLALARGGTNADLSASGGATHVLAQAADHTVSARALVGADIPVLTSLKVAINANNALQSSAGNVNFASTGVWRTIATLTFGSASTYAGGYLVCAFGGVQSGAGGAKAVLTGTFDASDGTITFTQITNAVTACSIQAVSGGSTTLVIQMKSSSGANILAGSFSVIMMGWANNSIVLTTPGYSD